MAETKAKDEQKVPCKVLRDFWPTDFQKDRVRAGTVIDLSPMDAITAIESGAVERVK